MNLDRKLIFIDPRISRAIIGAIFGAVFFLVIAFPSNKAFDAMNNWSAQCRLENFSPGTTTSSASGSETTQIVIDSPSECDTHLSKFIFALLQSSLFGPTIFIALVFPITWNLVQTFYLPLAAIFFAMIGAYLMAHYSVKQGVRRFLLSYFAITILITLYTFVLGLIVNA